MPGIRWRNWKSTTGENDIHIYPRSETDSAAKGSAGCWVQIKFKLVLDVLRYMFIWWVLECLYFKLYLLNFFFVSFLCWIKLLIIIFVVYWKYVQYLIFLQFHLFSMSHHMRNKQIGRHKIRAADFAFEISVGVVRFQMASEMSRPSITLLAVLDDASVVSWRRNLVGASVAAFKAWAFWSRSTTVFERGFFIMKLEGLWRFVGMSWSWWGGEVRIHGGLKGLSVEVGWWKARGEEVLCRICRSIRSSVRWGIRSWSWNWSGWWIVIVRNAGNCGDAGWRGAVSSTCVG